MGASIVAVCAALAALIKFGGCGSGEDGRYDADTEAALQHAIRPTMVRIAKKATHLVAREPLNHANASEGLRANRGWENNPDEVRIVLTNNSNGIERRLDVVTGLKHNGKPDPHTVEFVQTNVSYTDSMTGNERSSGTYLAAPYSEEDDSGLTGPLVAGDTHENGWSAGMIGIATSDGELVSDSGYVIDSSDSNFLRDEFGSSIGSDATPVTTAEYVVTQGTLPAFRDVLHP